MKSNYEPSFKSSFGFFVNHLSAKSRPSQASTKIWRTYKYKFSRQRKSWRNSSTHPDTKTLKPQTLSTLGRLKKLYAFFVTLVKNH